MNNFTPLPSNPAESLLQTPWPRDPSFNPVSFLDGLGAWPGFPSVEMMKPAVSVADKKAMLGFITRHNAAKASQEANDAPGVLEEINKLSRENNYHALVEAERLRRFVGTLDLDGYHAATNEITAVDKESRQWAADWCERAAIKLWASFEEEAKQVEDRIVRLGGRMVETRMVDGYSVDFWTPHSDPLLAGMYYAVWSLAFYFPANFRNPQYYTGGPLSLFGDLTRD